MIWVQRKSRRVLSLSFVRRVLRAASVFVAAAGLSVAACAQIGGSDWTPQAPTFKVQWPYNVAESSRYTYDSTTGIYHMWVYSTDEPFKEGSTTLPRTEQRFEPDYTSGEIQYQAMLMGDPTENSYCIFQIHTGDAQSAEYGSTTFMLFWFSSDGGSVHDYSGTELVGNLGSNWFQLNVDHNMVTRTITVWINKKQVWQQQDNGAGDFYMKDGVYEQNHNPTSEMQAYAKDIQFWTSPGSSGSPGFSIAPSPTSMTLQAGQSAKTTITVTPKDGFNGQVSFGCSGLPVGTSCSFSPQTVTPSVVAASTTLTVSDSGMGAAHNGRITMLFPGVALAGLFWCFGWRKRQYGQMLLLLAVCIAVMGSVIGCGSSVGASGSQSSTSTVTVTAKSGPDSQSTTFSLTVT